MELSVYVVDMKDCLLGNDFLSMNFERTFASFFGILSTEKGGRLLLFLERG